MELESPFPEYAWPLVWGWMRPFLKRLADDFAPQTIEQFVEWSIERQARARTWGVRRDGELGGLIVFEPSNPAMGMLHVVFKRSFWGRGTTAVALRQVYGEIFAAGFQKIGSAVFGDNRAVRELAKRTGGIQEGLVRSATLRDGQPIDVVLFGITRRDFYGVDDAVNGADRRTQQHAGGADVDQQHHADLHGRPDRAADHAGVHVAGPVEEWRGPGPAAD